MLSPELDSDIIIYTEILSIHLCRIIDKMSNPNHRS